jgi:hypothetical protein
MATSATSGSGSLFQLGDGASPEGWTTIGEGATVAPIGVKKDLIEVTHFQSTAREYIGGLSDGQEFEVTCNYVPTNATQLALIGFANTQSAAKNFRFFPGSGSLKFWFAALVQGWSMGPTDPNSKNTISFQFKISGPVSGPAL